MKEHTWTFETEEQARGFLDWFLDLDAHKQRSPFIALRSPHNPLAVILNDLCLPWMAQAYQSGWMAGENNKQKESDE